MKKMKWLVAALAAVSILSILVSAHIYSKAIATVRMRALMLYSDSCAAETQNPVLHWTFDEVGGNQTPDQSGNNNSGTLGSLFDDHRIFFPIPSSFRSWALPDQVPGVGGKALRFGGKNWVHGGNKGCYSSEKFTLSLWAWMDPPLPVTEKSWKVPTLAAKSQWPGNGWWLCTQPNTANIDMAISWGAKRRHLHSGYAMPSNEWHHIAVTMDNEAREARFFIDGAPYGEKHVNVEKWIANWDQNLYVGDYDGTAKWPWFGRIDNVRFYNTVLPPEDILAIYQGEAKNP